jgi:hypothetical protein
MNLLQYNLPSKSEENSYRNTFFLTDIQHNLSFQKHIFYIFPLK